MPFPWPRQLFCSIGGPSSIFLLTAGSVPILCPIFLFRFYYRHCFVWYGALFRNYVQIGFAYCYLWRLWLHSALEGNCPWRFRPELWAAHRLLLPVADLYRKAISISLEIFQVRTGNTYLILFHFFKELDIGLGGNTWIHYNYGLSIGITCFLIEL